MEQELRVTVPTTPEDEKEYTDFVYSNSYKDHDWPLEALYTTSSRSEAQRKFLFRDSASGGLVAAGEVMLIEEQAGVAAIKNIAVAPIWRHRGIGTLMVRLLESEALAMGAHKLLVHSFYENEAYFRSRGYKFFEEEFHFFNGVLFVGIRLEKDLLEPKL